MLRPPFQAIDQNGKSVALFRVDSLDPYVRFSHRWGMSCSLGLAQWARDKLEQQEGHSYALTFSKYFQYAGLPYSNLFHGRNRVPNTSPKREFISFKNRFDHEPFARAWPFWGYDVHLSELEWRLDFQAVENHRKLSLALSSPQSAFGRKLWGSVSGLNEKFAEVYRLWDEAKPSYGLHRDLTDTANKMGDQLHLIDNAMTATKALLAQIEERHRATETMLAEARSAQSATEKAARDLKAHFDQTMAQNQETMANLQAMCQTVLDAKDTFLNQPTQTATSDSNVAEILKLLTLLAKDESKGDKP